MRVIFLLVLMCGCASRELMVPSSTDLTEDAAVPANGDGGVAVDPLACAALKVEIARFGESHRSCNQHSDCAVAYTTCGAPVSCDVHLNNAGVPGLTALVEQWKA